MDKTYILRQRGRVGNGWRIFFLSFFSIPPGFPSLFADARFRCMRERVRGSLQVNYSYGSCPEEEDPLRSGRIADAESGSD